MPRGMLVDRLVLGPSRRRRHLRRRMRELDRWYAARSAGTGSHDRRRQVLVVLVTALVCGPVSLFVLNQQGLAVGLHGIGVRTGAGPARTVPGTGGYAFEAHQPGGSSEPVTYDPCRPIHVVENDAAGPPEASKLLGEALTKVARATGLRFVRDGATDELPSGHRGVRDPARYGLRRSPVLVAWTDPAQDHGLRGRVVGLGGSARVADPVTGRLQYVTGTVSLDAPSLQRIATQRRGRALVRAVMMHELGHVVGLAHVHEVAELMAAENHGVTSLGPGDRRGLAELGRGRCVG